MQEITRAMPRPLVDRSGGRVPPCHGKSWRDIVPAVLVMVAASLLAPVPAVCSASAMKGPGKAVHRHASPSPDPETSATGIVFLGLIDIYRNFVSPINGPRCGFQPSCSTFGRQAVAEYGAVRGVIMTGDRLTRCNIFKKPGPDYLLLPNGRLFDPVSANTLTDQ